MMVYNILVHSAITKHPDTRYYDKGNTWLSVIIGTYREYPKGRITTRNDLELLFQPLVF